MITTTWWADPERNCDCLECRKEEACGATAIKIDIVKVYFYSKFDVDTIKGRKLEINIAGTIFSNRAKYGDIVDAYLEVYPNTIHFRTGTDAQIYNEYWPPIPLIYRE